MRLIRDYALGWVLLILFIVFWIGQTIAGWQEFVADQAGHGQTAALFGEGGYVWNWARTTLENWQSEMLQLFAMVALTSFLIFRGSPESKDGDEEMKQTLARLERRLEALSNAHAGIPADGARAERVSHLPSRMTGD